MWAYRIAAIALFISGCSCAVEIQRQKESVSERVGEEVTLVCSVIGAEKQACSFTPPSGALITILNGARYEGGRLAEFKPNENDCGIKIVRLEEKDNGVWKCTVPVIGPSGDFESMEALINVTVAVPPSGVSLRLDNEPILSQTVNLKPSQERNIDCVAADARPRPEFRWFIGDTEIQGTKHDSVENPLPNGKATYVQTLVYYAASKHNGQDIKCVVDHMAYTEVQKQAFENEAKKRIEVTFKPEPKKPQNFYGLKEGQQNEIMLKFEANPRPSNGQWTLHSLSSPVAFGSGSLDQQFEAGMIEEGDTDSEFIARLTIKKLTKEMAGGKKNKLTVTNDEGTTEYEFTLELGEKPPAEPLGTGPIVGVIVVVILIVLLVVVAVVARAKGILCFAKRGQRKEDKQKAVEKDGEGSDTESAEHTDDKTKPTDEAGDGADAATTTPRKAASVTARMSNFLAAVKKTVSPAAKREKEHANDLEANRDAGDADNGNIKRDDVTYADLDKSAMAKGKRSSPTNEEPERTEYAEIQPKKD